MNVVLYLLRLYKVNDIVFTQKSRLEHVQFALRRLRNALGLMILVVLLGTFGYRLIEHVPWFDAYYMSLVTLSTVGFGEVITLSHQGRIFTSFLILFNIGFFAYAISTVTSIFADSDIHAFFSDLKMMNRIKQLHHHTIVCGFGRHAGEVCKELANQKMPFVVIELDPEKIEGLHRDTSYFYIKGDATLDVVLIEAGIERAKALVVTLPFDANNLFIVLSARQINPDLKIISRLNNPVDIGKLQRAGANHVVMPEQSGGFYMAALKPNLMDFFSLITKMGKNEAIFKEIEVSQLNRQFQSKTMEESGIQYATKIPILAIRHSNGHYELNPLPEVILKPDMQIVVLGDGEQIKYFCSVALADPTA